MSDLDGTNAVCQRNDIGDILVQKLLDIRVRQQDRFFIPKHLFFLYHYLLLKEVMTSKNLPILIMYKRKREDWLLLI